MKKLYQADGYAVKELLKVTSVLYNAVKTNVTNLKDQPVDDLDSSVSFDISAKVCINLLSIALFCMFKNFLIMITFAPRIPSSYILFENHCQ